MFGGSNPRGVKSLLVCAHPPASGFVVLVNAAPWSVGIKHSQTADLPFGLYLFALLLLAMLGSRAESERPALQVSG